MFYIIATVLFIISMFFLYSAISAFNELRKGIKKKVQAKPYMVVLFSVVAIILSILSYASIVYQTSWDQIWNNFWIDKTPMMSEESKAKIYNIVQTVEPIMMYGAFIFGGLFTLSLLKLKKLTAHLFVGTISLAVMTFLCFIISQYTEPSESANIPQQHQITEKSIEVKEINTPDMDIEEISEIDRDSITRYFKNDYTDVLKLTQSLKAHFRISRNINDANVDQLKQYLRGLTEIKQNLVHIKIASGAEEAAALTQRWLQQEINMVNDCIAEKKETGILGIIVSARNYISELIFSKNKAHHDTTDKLRTMRSTFINDTKVYEDLDLKEYFSFIK